MKLAPLENTTQLLLECRFDQRAGLCDWMRRLRLLGILKGLEMTWQVKGWIWPEFYIRITGGTLEERTAFGELIAAECRP